MEVVTGRLFPERGLEKLYSIHVASDYSINYEVFHKLVEDIEELRNGYDSIYGEIRYLGEKDQVIAHHCSLLLSCPLAVAVQGATRKFDPNWAYCHRCWRRVDHHYVYRWAGWLPPQRRRVAVCNQCGVTEVAEPGKYVY